MSSSTTLDGEQLLTELLAATGAQRATLRLDVAGMDFPVVAEALEAGVPTIRDDTSVDQRGAATAQWIMRTREVLVQSDIALVDPPPPPELVAAYGVRAQMLGPVVADGEVVGWISVHSTSARAWSGDHVAALERAAGLVARHLPELHPAGAAGGAGERKEAELANGDQ
ncbi:MAG TPA: GAF domain-containing protein [Conexibacter sp.]|nr:GAF domain-containing protein [Conexibacter sp.]